MQYYYMFDLNFFAIFMLLIIYVTMKIRNNSPGISNKILGQLIIINVFMLAIEIGSWVFEGRPGKTCWYMNYTVNAVFTWISPLINCVWVCYFDYQIHGSIERLKKRWLYMYPMIINTILVIVNVFYPIYFSIDSDNMYQRGTMMWLAISLNIVTYLYAYVLIYRNRKQSNNFNTSVILAYLIMPLTAVFAQYMFFGALLIWPTMAVTIMAIYIFIENTSTSTDYLTGLKNRHCVDDCIDYQIENQNEFGLIMIDLDDFKSINDTYGHLSGDMALRVFARVLAKVFKKAKVVGRFAGDEFIVVTAVLTDEKIRLYYDAIDKELEKELKDVKVAFDINYSVGYENSRVADRYNYETLINLTDERMYEHKRMKDMRQDSIS